MNTHRAINFSLAGLLVVVLIAGIIGMNVFQGRMEARAAGHLTTMLMLRESVLRSYFESLRSEVALWSSRAVVIDIFDLLTRAQEAQDHDTVADFGTVQSGEIQSAPTTRDDVPMDVRVREFAEHHQYYDVFFISAAGDVLFTAAKEADYGTNLVDGPYADSGLGRLFQTLLESGDDVIAFEDFSVYGPSGHQPAAFLGAKVYSGDSFTGVYAVQIPEATVNDIMQFSAGMGETGETYLVGEDRLMRSDSRFFENSSVLTTRVSGTTVDKAFNGELGLEIVEDYRGTTVFSAFRLFEFEGIRWAVLAEQDVAEIEAPIILAWLWLAGAFVLLCCIVILLRLMLIRVVLPASLAAFLGLSFVSLADD